MEKGFYKRTEVRHKASPVFSKPGLPADSGRMRVYLLKGEDEFTKRLYLERLKSELLGKKIDAFNYELYYGSQDCLEELIRSLDTLQPSAGKKMIVLDEIELLPEKDKQRLINYLKRPRPSQTLLVLLSDGPSRRDDSFSLAVSEYATIVDFSKLKPEEVSAWVVKEFKARNKVINRQAAGLISAMSSYDLGRAFSVIEQLSLFTGDREKVTDEDVAAFAEDGSEISIYRLLDTVNQKDARRSLTILRQLFHSGDEPRSIIGLLNWHIGRLITIKKMMIKKIPRHRMLSYFNMGGYTLDSLISQAENFTLGQLKDNLRTLLDTDLSLKRSGIKGEILLEMLVVRLCA